MHKTEKLIAKSILGVFGIIILSSSISLAKDNMTRKHPVDMSRMFADKSQWLIKEEAKNDDREDVKPAVEQIVATDNSYLGIIKRVAGEEGIDWKVLYSIAVVETRCNPNAIGDGGNSYGAFQIYLPAHPTITKKQATDFEWSARWTAKRIAKYSDLNLQFKQHNGIGKKR